MNIKKLFLIITTFSIGLSACGEPSTPVSTSQGSSININESAVSTNIEAEEIYLNNCGNQAASEQTSERSQTVSLEGGGQLGVSAEVVQASVEGKYIATKGVTKSQKVTAAPNTNMKFTLLWTEQVNDGTITVNNHSGQAAYKVKVPISVEQTSAQDLGCPNNPSTSGPFATSTVSAPPPAAITLQDTTPGTALNVGQTWIQGGAELTLTEMILHPDREDFYGQLYTAWKYTNISPNDIILTFGHSNFAAQTNLGSQLKILEFYSGSFWCDNASIVVKSGDSLDFSYMCGSGSSGYMLPIVVNLGNKQITEVVVSVNGISSITDAKWRIPIFH